MNEWIKPSDRMPDVNENVIISRMYDENAPIVEQGHWEGPVGDWWKVYGTRVKTKNIGAWMPMPEPYSESKQFEKELAGTIAKGLQNGLEEDE